MPSGTPIKHNRTKQRCALVVECRARGMLRKHIAEKLKISVEQLKELYPKSLKKGDKLKAERSKLKSPHNELNASQVQWPSLKAPPPPNCPVPMEHLVKNRHRIFKYDMDGMPLDSRGNPVFGKKALAEIMADRVHIGTEWEHVIEPSKDYRKITLTDVPWDFSNEKWEDLFDEKYIGKYRSLMPPDLRMKNIDLGKSEIGKDYTFSGSKKFNVELAQRAVAAFNKLRLSDVPGNPQMAEAGDDWFREIVAIIFGCYDPATKSRKIKELFLLVPKKNNKTTGGALIMLLLLIFNERPRGEAIMTAPVQDVAEIAFEAIAGAIRLDPVLEQMFTVKAHKKLVIHKKTKATLTVMTFDPKSLTGQKVFAALIDELHVLSKVSKADRALRQIRGGMLPFPEAILIFITTESEEAPAGVFGSELQAARDVRDGKRKGSKLLPILYEFPKSFQQDVDQPWKNKKLWPLVTPNAGKSITIDALYTSFLDAEAKGEAELRAWASQHLNIEIGVALRCDSWVGAELLAKKDPEAVITLKEILEASEVVTAGVDGGGLDDLLSLSIMGRERGTGRWLNWTMSWAHPIVLERRKSEAPKLLDFEKAGELKVVKNIGEDVVELVDLIMQCEKAGVLDKIGLDPHGVGTIVDAILAQGIEQERVVGISQGWRLGGAIMTMERVIAEGKMHTGGQGIMKWAIGNAKIEPRGNAKLITKAASGSAKIDPLMASLNSLHLMAGNPESKSKKYQILVFGGRKAA